MLVDDTNLIPYTNPIDIYIGHSNHEKNDREIEWLDDDYTYTRDTLFWSASYTNKSRPIICTYSIKQPKTVKLDKKNYKPLKWKKLFS